ncbi:hypothetical protein Mycch_1710 [Mycolicibacterium chubuense NBB4]|uniref:Uncharacterized protein n=1 Tax=Mycolicibacterium chubuense (strain NBB4) TaxID=710421 RepID=I4BGU4_MYCCN|nr:hypothetical protein [Mycolicibacterium chubuense]AFM16501.1 hypothetical protein Mycch_1710 [Mycolicibacterium chubuense NBB4]
MSWELDWDDEVDVVCSNAGLAGLASAVAAADAGADVFVADGPPDARRWLLPECADPDTASYFHQLTADLSVDDLPPVDSDLPVRLVQAAPPAGRSAPPFIGSRLRDWAALCIGSPTGYLYSRIGDQTASRVANAAGELFEVTEVGSVVPDPQDPSGSVARWLADEAQTRSVDVVAVTGFERLVFEEGMVTGAVFATGTGPLAVRARHGVLICRAAARDSAAGRAPTEGEPLLRVALVGKEGSRFGRVELLTSDSAVASGPW